MRKVLFLALALLIGLAPGVQPSSRRATSTAPSPTSPGPSCPAPPSPSTSDLGNRSTTTGSQGEFRFLNLDRGRYKVTVAIAGFTSP